MAAPTSLRREVFSCQLGAVHTWHIAAEPYVHYDGSYRRISGPDASNQNPTRLILLDIGVGILGKLDGRGLRRNDGSGRRLLLAGH